MYENVFSALMTLMGLSFAAIGLLLQGQEKHWLRHAEVWRSLRKEMLLAGATVATASAFALVHIRPNSADPFSPTWWWMVALFVLSLISLSVLIQRTVVNVREIVILKKIEARHFDVRSATVESRIKDYYTTIKQLLLASLELGDIATYDDVLQFAITRTSHPYYSFSKPLAYQLTTPDFEFNSNLAVEGLAELRSQMERAAEDRQMMRPVFLSCMESFSTIIDQRVSLRHQDFVNEVEWNGCKDDHQEVLERAMENIGVIAELVLSANRPSLTLAREVAQILHKLKGGESEGNRRRFPASTIDEVNRRILNGASRAISARYVEEARQILDAAQAWVVPDFDVFRLLIGQLAIDPIRTKPLNDLVLSVIERVAGSESNHELVRAGFDELEKADDDICERFVQCYVAHNEHLKPTSVLIFRNFLCERLASYDGTVEQAVQRLCRWLYRSACYVAEKNKAERLTILRKSAVYAVRELYAARGTGTEANVNPVFLAMIMAVAKTEKAQLKSHVEGAIKNWEEKNELSKGDAAGKPVGKCHVSVQLTLPSDTLINPEAGSKSFAENLGDRRPVRVSYDVRLHEIGSLMKEDLWPENVEAGSAGFSAELRRAILASVSLLVVDLSDDEPSAQLDLLTDEKIVMACELALAWPPTDLGDVSMYVSHIRDAARLVSATDWVKGRHDVDLLVRWHILGYLCDAALAIVAAGNPDSRTTNDADETAASPAAFWQDSQLTPRTFTGLVDEADEILRVLLDGTTPLAPAERTAQYVRLLTLAESYKVKSARITGISRDRKWTSHESDVLNEWKAQFGRDMDLSDGLSSLVLVNMARARLPEWANATSELLDECITNSNVGLAFYALRALRACFSRENGRINFVEKSIFYVYKTRDLDTPLSNEWINRAFESVLSDWLAYRHGDDEVGRQKEHSRIQGIVRSHRHRTPARKRSR